MEWSLPDVQANGPNVHDSWTLWGTIEEVPFRPTNLSMGLKWKDQGWGNAKGAAEIKVLRGKCDHAHDVQSEWGENGSGNCKNVV